LSASSARVSLSEQAGWADIGGEFNLNVRIDAEPPLVLRVHRPWVRRGRVAGLRRLRERLGRTQVRVARPIRISGGVLLRAGDRWAELEEFIGHVQPPAGEDSSVRLLEELGRVHTALKAVWEPSPPEPLDDHRTLGQRGRTARRLMGHLRPGFREGQGAAVRHRGQPEPRRAERRTARAATTARRLRKHGAGTADSRRAPLAPRGSDPYTPALGCHRRTRGRRHPRGRDPAGSRARRR
jgi:hypothetical protein